ncbi:MAG: Hsp70 family protein [Gloeocapsa sp. DLM2.Bin57]|nr:MAG: Hsp70 family protein [Gloeocapsa sp. DLM2.Bin57]
MTTVAIDFGTSNTIVCILDPVSQKPRTLKFKGISREFEGTGVSTVPTLVFVENNNTFSFGEQIRSQRKGLAQPERYFQSFKRNLVADYQAPPRLIDGKAYSAQDISELFLKNIWQHLAQQQIEPTQVIFTVPVGAFERYLDWFRDFSEQLKITNVQLVDESTAAALGYAVQKIGSLVLVVDFGGGTLDLSLVRTKPANNNILQAEVLAKSDAYIGGVDVDTWIVEEYLQQIKSSRSEVKEIGWLNLLEIAEKLKIKLSQTNQAAESWFDDENFIAHELVLERGKLAEILESRQMLQQLRDALDEILEIARNKGIKKADIEQVLLVGGSCLIPTVQQLIVSYFGQDRVRLNKPFEAIAHGALALSQLVQVEDYLRHGYAIRLWEPQEKCYIYHPLFNAGIKYPAKKERPLLLQVAQNGQTEINLDIGEVAETSQAEVTFDTDGKMTSTQLYKQTAFRSLENNSQLVCVAHLEPPGKLGENRISVEFEVDQGRVLIATVTDIITNKVLVNRVAIAKLK